LFVTGFGAISSQKLIRGGDDLIRRSCSGTATSIVDSQINASSGSSFRVAASEAKLRCMTEPARWDITSKTDWGRLIASSCADVSDGQTLRSE
jgi:hypothetical protein